LSDGQAMKSMPRSFEDIDQNKDGVVTREEFEAAFPR